MAKTYKGAIAGDLILEKGDDAKAVTSIEPALSRGERAINVKMTLPLALFEAPSIIARIDVAEPASPVTIDTAAVAQAVKTAIGMDIDLRVAAPGEGEHG